MDQPKDVPRTSVRRWSYSSLAQWRACPRQWELARARDVTTSALVPQRVSPAAVHGSVVHGAVEDFIRHWQDARTSFADARKTFDIRTAVKSRITIEVDNIAHGARGDPDSARRRLSVDACVTDVKTMLRGLASEVPTARVLGSDSSVRSRVDAEVWLETAEPPLCGRVDLLSDAGITDYKTNEPRESHIEQMRFYALLYWLCSGEIIEGLRLVYAGGKEVHITPPSVEELVSMRDAVTAELANIAGSIAAGHIPAYPSDMTCRWCHVRQSCESYWVSDTVTNVRLDAIGAPVIGFAVYGDCEVRVSKILNTLGSVIIDGTLNNGVALRGVLNHATFEGVTEQQTLRLLNVKALFDGTRWEIAETSTTEVYAPT